MPCARLQVVVNTAADSVLQADGAALSAFQYFENVRNFLVAAQEIGLPCFEASDLEQVCFGARVVGHHHLALLAAAATCHHTVAFCAHTLEEAVTLMCLFPFWAQGGKSARVVNCVLALKSYGDWKQCGGTGPWKYGGNLKVTASGKSFGRKNSEPFRRSQSMNEGEVLYEEAGFNADSHLDSSDMVSSTL